MSILSDLIAEGHGSRTIRTKPSPNHRAPGAGAGARQGAKPADPNDQSLSIYARANACDTRELLGRLGIECEEQAGGKVFATCPGCHEPGAMVCQGGGLKCLHDRCANAGVPGRPGFRPNVDLAMLVLDLAKLQAAKQIFEWFGLHEEGPFTDDAGDAGEPAQAKPKSNRFRSAGLQPGSSLDPEWMTTPLGPQNWLLTRDGKGVFVRYKVGMLVADGGAGKTFALCGLAFAVATGGMWLETFKVPKPGHVVVLAGEEDPEEIRRRVHKQCQALGFTRAQSLAAASHLHVIPLHGVDVTLVRNNQEGELVPTEALAELKSSLDALGVDIDLIVIDTFSRFAGGSAETDNVAAAKFITYLEMLTSIRGRPNVVVAHHSSKASVANGDPGVRGSSALSNNARWVASLTVVTASDDDPLHPELEGVVMRFKKGNGAAKFTEVYLARCISEETGGVLRLATMLERSALAGEGGKKKKKTPEVTAENAAAADAAIDQKIRRAVAAGGITSGNSICAAIGGDRNKVRVRIGAMLARGEILDATKIWTLRGPDETPTKNDPGKHGSN